MAKVLASELSGGAIANAIALLEGEKADTDKLKIALHSFINGTTEILTGPAYDAARKKAESYMSTLDTRSRLATELAASLQAALSSMAGYMDGYSELDDSKLPEIENQMSSIRATINQIIYNYNNTQGSSGGYSSLIAPYEAQYQELDKLKQKLEGLAGADSAAYGKLGSLTGQISSYETNISMMNTSSINV